MKWGYNTGMLKTTIPTDADLFTAKLAAYKELIDADIKEYSKQLERETLQHFGVNARLAVDTYLSVLERGGKRIRGALTMLAYEMCGGTDQKMIIQAARALEMLHAYILIIDDFQDRSGIRRGGPTAHVLLGNYHRRHELANDSEHFGASIAINAALTGSHAAQLVLAGLKVDPARKLQAIDTINHTMVVTAHGQTNDIMNEVVAEVTYRDIERVLEWKTAHYTFLNPLTVGMILAGADDKSIKGITDYAVHAGKAFQITDDILGTFGSEFESGKSPMDDIREGKRTLIIAHALEHTNDDNKNFLVQMLGNAQLTPVEFERCKDILVESGALDYAQKAAQKHVAQAVNSLDDHPKNWSDQGVQFLRGLASYLLQRTA
jgi:geranylgeranyl diphosphate synthase type I